MPRADLCAAPSPARAGDPPAGWGTPVQHAEESCTAAPAAGPPASRRARTAAGACGRDRTDPPPRARLELSRRPAARPRPSGSTSGMSWYWPCGSYRDIFRDEHREPFCTANEAAAPRRAKSTAPMHARHPSGELEGRSRTAEVGTSPRSGARGTGSRRLHLRVSSAPCRCAAAPIATGGRARGAKKVELPRPRSWATGVGGRLLLRRLRVPGGRRRARDAVTSGADKRRVFWGKVRRRPERSRRRPRDEEKA